MLPATLGELRTGYRPVDLAARLLDRLTVAMSVVGTLGILAIMVLIACDVIGRGMFGRPIMGVPEIISMSILGIVFLQLANTLARGKLTRADALINQLARRAPRVGLFVDAVMHAAGALLTGVLVTAFYPLFLRSYGRNETVGTVGQFIAPIWPVHFIVLAGATVLCAVFVMRAVALFILAFQSAAQERSEP